MRDRSIRPLGAPRPLRVITTPADVPAAVVLDDRPRAVVAVREDWLVQDRWWTEEPVDRHYFDLLLEPGRPLVVYREIRSGLWYAHEEPRRRAGARPGGRDRSVG